jgi:hypothetical protein
MTLPDLSILLHAVNGASPRHQTCSTWLESIVNEGEETLGQPWTVRLGFLRLSTSPRNFERPLEIQDACGWLDELTSRPRVVALDPGPAHAAILRHLLLAAGTRGNLVTDARTAALAMEWDATIVTGDRDFQCFPGLKVMYLY